MIDLDDLTKKILNADVRGHEGPELRSLLLDAMAELRVFRASHDAGTVASAVENAVIASAGGDMDGPMPGEDVGDTGGIIDLRGMKNT